MLSVRPLLDSALKQHQAGNLPQAEQIYRQVLQQDPHNVDALHLLGLIVHQSGRKDEGIGYLRQAVRLKPDFAIAHNNLGLALAEQGQLSDAVACYQQALRLQPGYVQALNNLAHALRSQGKLAEAMQSLQQALRLKPDYAEAHNSLGSVLQEQGQLAKAAACYRQALHCRPSFADAHNNLGNVLLEQGQFTEAVASYREAIRLKPDFAEAHYNLGNALREHGQLDEAIQSLRAAVRIQPTFAQAHNNLGFALDAQGKITEAATCYQQALALEPDNAEAHNNLGNALETQGRIDEAIACYDRALRLRPDFPEAHLNRSLTWLLLGQYEQGWLEYEWRWKCKQTTPRTFRQPLWDGTPLNGRTILLHAEQGLGDTLQFIRYAALVKQFGGTVLVECQKPLLRLLGSCPGIDRLVARGSLAPDSFDVHAPLLSLPGILKTTLDSVPAQVPYLFADTTLIEHWRKELAGLVGLRIGIVWQGSRGFRGDRFRSFPLPAFAPLAAVEGVRLVSLQKGAGTEQIQQAAELFTVTDLSSRLDEESGPFMDTAAVMKNLDLVITPNSALAHLAGALGVRAWVALSTTPEWRWLLEREDSPWYPTLRLFRQSEAGNWNTVFERMAAEIKRMQGGAAFPSAPAGEG